MKVKKRFWDTLNDTEYNIYRFEDGSTGFFAEFTELGAALVRLGIPGKKKKIYEVVYGQDTPGEYIKEGGYLGAVIGRFANRIANGTFELEGKRYKLYINDSGKHTLHGGKEGFNVKKWECIDFGSRGNRGYIHFRYTSPDGEEGFPGNLTVDVKYSVEPMQIGWTIEAVTDSTTVVNLTNHSYWNLEGIHTPIDNQYIRVDADKFMPTDETCLPTGEIKNVKGTPYDLRIPKKFSEIFEILDGIDNNYFLKRYTEGNPKPFFAASVYSPRSGIFMKVYTTEPCIQVYTGNFMGTFRSFGKKTIKHGAVCLECQRPPNAINIDDLAEWVILRPGETYYQKTVHIFEIVEKERDPFELI